MAIFDNASLQKHIDEAFQQAPPGKSVAKIQVGFDGTVETSFAVRVGQKVEVGAVFKRVPGTVQNPQGTLEGGAQIKLVW